MVSLSTDDQARIADAIADAESRTSGEILCTLSTERHRYVEWVLALAALAAFALPAIATLAGFGPTRWAAMLGLWQQGPLDDRQMIELYAGAQAVTLLLATLALWWSPFAQAWAPRGLRQDRVHEIALKQFLARGIHLTAGRTGVLVHVSLEDHVVEIVADEGIYTRVPPDHWGEAAEALLAGVKAGDIAGGFVAAIGRVGDTLAAHFPPGSSNPDELPNQLLIV